MTENIVDETVDEIVDGPILPPVRQPTGVQYYFGTWSGRLIIANTLVLLAMILIDHSIFLPSSAVLDAVGAKDPVAIANGEWWRFATPIFVHVGVIHFAFNTLGLFYIGYQLERVLGARWFMAVYLLSGIAGNISSSVFTVGMSAGASGALFGLLGSGYFLERTIGDHIKSVTGHRPRRSIYSGMVGINILLGFIVPGIDNAAHLGGLVVGVFIAFVMVNARPNQLQAKNIPRALLATAVVSALAVAGVALGTNKKFVSSRLENAGDKAEVISQSYHFYSEVLKIDPLNSSVLIKRARILLLNGDTGSGMSDLRLAVLDEPAKDAILKLVLELKAAGYFDVASEVESIITEPPAISL